MFDSVFKTAKGGGEYLKSSGVMILSTASVHSSVAALGHGSAE